MSELLELARRIEQATGPDDHKTIAETTKAIMTALGYSLRLGQYFRPDNGGKERPMNRGELDGKRAFSYVIHGVDYGFAWDTRDQRAKVCIELLKMGLHYKGVAALIELAPGTVRHEVWLYRKRHNIKQRVKNRLTGPTVATHWYVPAGTYAQISRYARDKGTPIYVAAVDIMVAGLKATGRAE